MIHNIYKKIDVEMYQKWERGVSNVSFSEWNETKLLHQLIKKYTLNLQWTINKLEYRGNTLTVQYKWILKNRIHSYAVACQTLQYPIKNPRSVCRDIEWACRGMSSEYVAAWHNYATQKFLKSSFFLYLVLNKVIINSQLL